MNKIRTELSERYGKARIIGRYNKETGELIEYKVYDAQRHVVLTATDYKKAKDVLMNGSIAR